MSNVRESPGAVGALSHVCHCWETPLSSIVKLLEDRHTCGSQFTSSSPSSQVTTRTTLMAAAVPICWRRVLSRSIGRERCIQTHGLLVRWWPLYQQYKESYNKH